MVDEAEDASPLLRRRVAARVSVVAHPFVLIPALVAVVTARSLPAREAAAVVALVVAGSMLPMLGIIVRRARSGAWTDHDVAVRDQGDRDALLGAGIGVAPLLWPV
ncbi:MAG: hypothetical protein ACJ76J_20635 [Thermoanaerobaculia bacterium]